MTTKRNGKYDLPLNAMMARINGILAEQGLEVALNSAYGGHQLVLITAGKPRGSVDRFIPDGFVSKKQLIDLARMWLSGVDNVRYGQFTPLDRNVDNSASHTETTRMFHRFESWLCTVVYRSKWMSYADHCERSGIRVAHLNGKYAVVEYAKADDGYPPSTMVVDHAVEYAKGRRIARYPLDVVDDVADTRSSASLEYTHTLADLTIMLAAATTSMSLYGTRR